MALDLQTWITILAVFATSILAVINDGLRKKQKSITSIPTSPAKPEKQAFFKWGLAGNVQKLIIFPIKSCPGITVDEAVVTKLGLKCRDHNIRDRDFMIVDKNGKQQTLEKHPTLTLISLELGEKDMITLNAPGMDPITFTYPDKTNAEERLCRVKHDKGMKALDCGDEIAEWFQLYLGKPDFRLYYHHINETQRTFEPYMYECPDFAPSDMGAFHNETAYLMVAQESIEELNARLNKDSSWKNWRPTILVDKINEPFAEVNWSFVRIGNGKGILKSSAPCYRCILTTVDPDEGILPRDGEPLKTLREMNKQDVFADRKVAELMKNKGIMGLRLGLYVPAGEGAVVKVNDPVYVALL